MQRVAVDASREQATRITVRIELRLIAPELLPARPILADGWAENGPEELRDVFLCLNLVVVSHGNAPSEESSLPSRQAHGRLDAEHGATGPVEVDRVRLREPLRQDDRPVDSSTRRTVGPVPLVLVQLPERTLNRLAGDGPHRGSRMSVLV